MFTPLQSFCNHTATAANSSDPNRQGTQGQYDGASNSTLDNEFGTHVDDEVIKKILESGNLLESEVRLALPQP